MTQSCPLIFLLLICALSGCASLQWQPSAQPKVALAPGQWVHLPTPQSLHLNAHASQILVAQHGEKTYTSQVAVEANAKKIVLVALAAWGSELFSIDYDGHHIHGKSLPIKHAAIGIKQTLTDFILAYASPAVIRTMLHATAIKLDARPKQRTLLLHGKPIIRITYQHENPWQGRVVLENILLDYTIKISTIEYKATS